MQHGKCLGTNRDISIASVVKCEWEITLVATKAIHSRYADTKMHSMMLCGCDTSPFDYPTDITYHNDKLH